MPDCSTDQRYMARALDLARQGLGLTRPNPPVGALIVRNGQVVGEGFHQRAGGPHAEVEALHEAGDEARGATLYVTLEPCSTTNRTPPCTEAILRYGLREVVVAMRDPNPKHAGRGIEMLRDQGVHVREGACRDQAEDLLAPFAKWITRGLPFVTLKLGMTLDGKIADAQRRSRWITSEASREYVQALRRASDVILVGGGTQRMDDPSLWPRPDLGRNPLRIIVSSQCNLDPKAQVLNDAHANRTLVATTATSPRERRRAVEQTGAQVLILPSIKGRVDLNALATRLGQMELLHILCEGGAELAWALVQADLVDEYRFFIAPFLLGGSESPGCIGGKGFTIQEKKPLHIKHSKTIGPDLLVTAEPVRGT